MTATGPLHGIRVLDLGTRVAAPFCAALLGEMGAEVIKVEQPGAGDFMRGIGPFVDTPEGPYSLSWAVEGRGRRSVTIDLRRPEGQGLLRGLAAACDVVVENFRPGTLEKWGLAPESLAEHLVVVRISAFGQDGPNAQRPGLDRVGIAYGGLLHLTGEPDRAPVRPGVTISDYLTGSFAAQAALAALYRRDAGAGYRGGHTGDGDGDGESGERPTAVETPTETGRPSRRRGRGAVVDACLYGSVLRILEWTIAAHDRLGVVRGREGNRVGTSAPLDNFPTADGHFVCLVGASDANFTRLCHAMERTDLLDDPRFTALSGRAAHAAEINDIVASWTRSLDAAQVERAAVANDVPVATAYTAADISADPHMLARGDLVTVDDPVAGPIRQQGPATRLVGEELPVPAGAPRLGEHTRQVLAELLDLDDQDLDALSVSGVI